jgi:hypothetical protein
MLCHACSSCTFHPSHHDDRPTRRSRRRAFCGRRICSGQAATPGPESFPTPFTQSACLRSRRRRLVCSPHAPRPTDPFRNRIETVLSLHRALNRKYRLLFSLKLRQKPGPKGPSAEVIAAVVQMKQRNPTWGCPRIAQQIALAFDIQINKDVVWRILAARYQPEPDSAGPSWLPFLGHMKDSLWSLDLFRCESATLWMMTANSEFARDRQRILFGHGKARSG